MSNLQLNAFGMAPMKGDVALETNPISIPVMVDPASVATIKPGDEVKLVTAVGATILVDKKGAGDIGFGVVLYNSKNQSYTAGMAMVVGCLGTITWAEASGTVTRGDQLEYVPTGTKQKTNAGNPVSGLALDSAVDGGLFRYLFLNGEAVPANITSGTINNAVIGGTTPVAGTFTTLHATGAVTFDGLVNGAGSSFGVFSKRVRTTIANVNAGATLLAAVSGRKWRVVAVKVIAIGADTTSTTATGVDIIGTQSTAVKLLATAKAQLTRSAVNSFTGTGATVLADGASFLANDANTAITIGADGGSDLAGATNIDTIIEASLE